MRALLICAVLVPAAAGASARMVRLSYQVEPGIERCPDERWVRQAVSARLGLEPFQEPTELTIEVRIARSGAALTATLRVLNTEGKSVGRRELASEKGDCLELASAMELAISIAVDPGYLTRPAPTPAPEPAVVPPPAPAEPVAPAPIVAPASPPAVAPTASTRPGFDALLGVHGAVGASPGLVPGVRLQVRARWPHASVAIEGRADLPGSVAVGTGSVSSSALLASVLGCFHVAWFGACAAGTFGAMQVYGALRSSSPLALAGVRALGDFALSQSWSLQPFIDVEAVVTRTTIFSGSDAIWVTWPVAVSAGLAVGFRFL